MCAACRARPLPSGTRLSSCGRAQDPRTRLVVALAATHPRPSVQARAPFIAQLGHRLVAVDVSAMYLQRQLAVPRCVRRASSPSGVGSDSTDPTYLSAKWRCSIVASSTACRHRAGPSLRAPGVPSTSMLAASATICRCQSAPWPGCLGKAIQYRSGIGANDIGPPWAAPAGTHSQFPRLATCVDVSGAPCSAQCFVWGRSKDVVLC
jgi:hypothetical protein